ncbi:MAG: AAA family ATPase [Bdellovibrionaceae bacterium]|nr:AAA family ATPase [Pseudobdellovibrionaceae bacterium]
MRADISPQSPELPIPAATLDELLRAWGLMRLPFTNDDKPTPLFPVPTHKEITELLDYTAALRSVMLLTGDPGTGKSSLIKTWIHSLEPKRYLPLLITQASLSATGVLEILLAKLGLRPGFKRSTNLITLEKHLADIDPMTLILILDDAQNYPAPALEEIRLLLGLGGRSRSAFALILLGDCYLLDTLRLSVQRALYSRIGARAALGPIPRADIPAFLHWQVARAGLDRDIFAPAALDLLAEASHGNPRTLNLLSQAAWLAAARSSSLTILPEHLHIALRQVPAALSLAK